MLSRRRFLEEVGMAAGAGVLGEALFKWRISRPEATQKAASRLWATDAGSESLDFPKSLKIK